MKEASQNVVCFGEVLWDNLPSGRKPGGAPMNVAYHLKTLGIKSPLLSKVGNDADGISLLNVLKTLGIDTDYCQVDQENSTSTVEVEITPDNEVKYDIVYPVAWDYIEFDDRFVKLLQNADAFVFGSLAARNSITRSTLDRIFSVARYKVFDVNLREPFYEQGYISRLLEKTDLLKLNIHELNLITNWYSSSSENESQRVSLLLERFNIKEIILTKGSAGAAYYTADAQYHCPAFEIEVNDTVGSGDSFLAAFLSKRLKGENIEEALKFASAVAAYITVQSGACPLYTRLDVLSFIKKRKFVLR